MTTQTKPITRREIQDRSYDKQHGACPVCERRQVLTKRGRVQQHINKDAGGRCAGSYSAPTTKPSVGGIVGGRGTYDAEMAAFYRKPGVAINDDPQAAPTARREAMRQYQAVPS